MQVFFVCIRLPIASSVRHTVLFGSKFFSVWERALADAAKESNKAELNNFCISTLNQEQKVVR